MSASTVDARTRRSVTIILLVASFISLASQTMMVTALPVIKNDLHVSLNAVQWLTTGYTLLIGVITPLSSNIYERFTNRGVFLSTVGTFIIGTLLGCFANNFWLLLLARLVQACAGGILMTFQMTTMITIYPPRKTRLRLGHVRPGYRFWTGFGAFIVRVDFGILLMALHFHLCTAFDAFGLDRCLL